METLKFIGALLGIVAFLWKACDLLVSYLRIELQVNAEHRGALSALTIVENKGWKPKRIENAILLVGPYSESPTDTTNHLLATLPVDLIHNFPRAVRSTNEIADLKMDKPLLGTQGRQLIPLVFYYSENVDIADERIGCRAYLSDTDIPSLVPYSVRFFVVGKGRLHRSTHEMFIFLN